MSNSTERVWASEDEAKTAQINGLLPGLFARRATLNAVGIEPTAVVLPVRLNPGAYDGPDATDMPAQIMGLPVVWGDRVGLVVDA